MLIICLYCRRIVGCCTPEGEPIDNCYHCPTKECRYQIKRGTSVVSEVLIVRFKSCLLHDSPHIGFKRKDEK